MLLHKVLKTYVSKRICIYIDNRLQTIGYKHLTLYEFADEDKKLHFYS